MGWLERFLLFFERLFPNIAVKVWAAWESAHLLQWVVEHWMISAVLAVVTAVAVAVVVDR
jgi:hypothetical protein